MYRHKIAAGKLMHMRRATICAYESCATKLQPRFFLLHFIVSLRLSLSLQRPSHFLHSSAYCTLSLAPFLFPVCSLYLSPSLARFSLSSFSLFFSTPLPLYHSSSKYIMSNQQIITVPIESGCLNDKCKNF